MPVRPALRNRSTRSTRHHPLQDVNTSAASCPSTSQLPLHFSFTPFHTFLLWKLNRPHSVRTLRVARESLRAVCYPHHSSPTTTAGSASPESAGRLRWSFRPSGRAAEQVTGTSLPATGRPRATLTAAHRRPTDPALAAHRWATVHRQPQLS